MQAFALRLVLTPRHLVDFDAWERKGAVGWGSSTMEKLVYRKLDSFQADHMSMTGTSRR